MSRDSVSHLVWPAHQPRVPHRLSYLPTRNLNPPFCFVLAYMMLEDQCVNLASFAPYFLDSRLLSCRPSFTL